MSAWLDPVARQHYTEEASELVKHERTDERCPKTGLHIQYTGEMI